MANTNDPRGFILVKSDGKQVRTRTYAKTASQVLYEGDPIERVSAGTVDLAAAGSTTWVGICAAFSPASATTVELYDDPDAEFLVQTDGTTAYAVADNGLNADIAAGTPDTTLNRSGVIVDMATKATTATLPVKILGLAAGINGGENGAGTNALIRVKLNQCERGAGVTGV